MKATTKLGDPLSPREKEVHDLLLENKTVQEIADMLFISPNTVKAHKKTIYKKKGYRGLYGLLTLENKRLREELNSARHEIERLKQRLEE